MKCSTCSIYFFKRMHFRISSMSKGVVNGVSAGWTTVSLKWQKQLGKENRLRKVRVLHVDITVIFAITEAKTFGLIVLSLT